MQLMEAHCYLLLASLTQHVLLAQKKKLVPIYFCVPLILCETITRTFLFARLILMQWYRCCFIQADEVWIAFGVGSSFRCIAVHEIVSTLSASECKNLPVFHAFTGCDTVSTFTGRGKKTAWQVWKAYQAVNGAFNELLSIPIEISEKSMLLLERFVVLMYDRTSKSKETAFRTQKSRTLEICLQHRRH